MKIALLGENYYPTVGGIQEHIYHLANYLRSQSHTVKVLTGLPKVSRWMGPQDDAWVQRVGRSVRYGVMGTYTNFTLGPGVAYRLRKLFEEEQFDILHVHGPCDFGLPMLAYAFFKGPKVATLHSAFKDSWSRKIVAKYYDLIMKHTDAVIAVSELAAVSMARYSDFEYQIIPNGVDLEFFARGRKIPEYDDGKINILFLGRLEPRNGVDLLLQALPMVFTRYPDARCLIAGSGPNGTTEYQALVPKEIKDQVVFFGAVESEERPNLFATASVFVLPARFGGSFSIMALEALASGTPLVSTPFVAEQYRDQHWDSTKFTEDYTPQAIARALCELLGENLQDRIAKGHEIVKSYAWPIIGRQIEQVYERLLTKG